MKMKTKTRNKKKGEEKIGNERRVHKHKRKQSHVRSHVRTVRKCEEKMVVKVNKIDLAMNIRPKTSYREKKTRDSYWSIDTDVVLQRSVPCTRALACLVTPAYFVACQMRQTFYIKSKVKNASLRCASLCLSALSAKSNRCYK